MRIKSTEPASGQGDTTRFIGGLFPVIVFLMAGLPSVGLEGKRVAEGVSPKVFAHYMPWFKAQKTGTGENVWDHWQWYGKGPKHDPDDLSANGHRDIASIYYPLIGPYDECDPAVLEYQMLTAKAAGIDGFIADWYGLDNYPDKVFAAMVKAAERYGFTVAICLEEKSFFPPYSHATTRAEVKDVMARQIRYVLDQYAPSEAYWHYDGHPVFLVFNSYGEGPLGDNTLSDDELRDVLSGFKDQKVLYVRGFVDRQSIGAAQGCYLWSADGRLLRERESYYQTGRAARESGQMQYWLGGCCPGFDDTGVWGWGQGPRVTDRRGTQEYKEQWQEVLRYRPDAVQLITWNDFQEGTTIEPAEQYGFTFVNLTEKYVEKYTGPPADLTDNEWPYRIYKLRRTVGALRDATRREACVRDLDSFAEAFARGRRFLMGERLRSLERRINQMAEDQQRSETEGVTK